MRNAHLKFASRDVHMTVEGANTMINANGRYITFSSDFTGQREIYRYDKISRDAKIYAVIGDKPRTNGRWASLSFR